MALCGRTRRETVAALAVNTGRPGKPTMLSLRPERVALNPADGECDTKVFGKVEELIYLGDHIRTRISVCGCDDFIVKVPNASKPSGLTFPASKFRSVGTKRLPGFGYASRRLESHHNNQDFES